MYSGSQTSKPNVSPNFKQLAKWFPYAREPLDRVHLDMEKEQLKHASNRKEFLAEIRQLCKAYLAYYEDDKYIKNTHGYGLCCEAAGICTIKDMSSDESKIAGPPFYMQTLFFVACGGVLLLLLIVGVVVGVFICRRRKGKSGGGGGQSGKSVKNGDKKSKKGDGKSTALF